HVHVEQVGAAPHLVERDLDRAREVTRLDQAAELNRAGDVGPLPDDHETGLGSDLERLQPAELRALDSFRDLSRRKAGYRLADLADVLRGSAAAAAGGGEKNACGRIARAAAFSRR